MIEFLELKQLLPKTVNNTVGKGERKDERVGKDNGNVISNPST